MKITIDILNKEHEIKYIGSLYYMFEEFRIENNLPEQDHGNYRGPIKMYGMSKRDFFDALGKWALDKYKMQVSPSFQNESVIQYITIGFDNMTESEVDEVFVTLFTGPEI